MNAGLLLFLAALPGGILSAATVKERKRRDKPRNGSCDAVRRPNFYSRKCLREKHLSPVG